MVWNEFLRCRFSPACMLLCSTRQQQLQAIIAQVRHSRNVTSGGRGRSEGGSGGDAPQSASQRLSSSSFLNDPRLYCALPLIAQNIFVPSVANQRRILDRFLCSSSSASEVSVDVLSTPNPDALKFLLDREVTGHLRTISFKHEDLEQKSQTVSSQLPAKLLAIPGIIPLSNPAFAMRCPGMTWDTRLQGVESLLLGFDFVT
eukprot:243874-Rhodomonas_salina.1